jgi:hypothetical protein
VTLDRKSSSPFSPTRYWSSLVSDVEAEWLDEVPAPRAISAVRGVVRVPSSGPQVPYESDLEADFLTFCRVEPEVRRVSARQLVLHFTDRSSNKRRRYTADFLVDLVPGSVSGHSKWLIEVKRRVDLWRNRQQLKACFAAARLWSKGQEGCRFQVITDSHMSGLRLTNARLLSGHLDSLIDVDVDLKCRSLLKGEQGIRLKEVIAKTSVLGLRSEHVLPVLYRMMARGELQVDQGRRITFDTWVKVERL